MKTWILFTAAFVALLLPRFATAADKFDAAAAAKTIAPFIDDETLAVVRIDVARLNVDAVLAELKKLVPVPMEEVAKAQPLADKAVRDFKAAGGQEAYVVVSLRDLPRNPPLIVVPVAAGGDAAAMQAMLRNFLGGAARSGDAVIASQPAVIERARAIAPHNRPELQAAFAAAGDSLVQVLLLPTDDNRRVIEQTMPELPPQVGGGSITTLSHGLSWLSVGIDATPQVAVHVTMQSPDAKSAQQLADLWNKGLEAMRTDPVLQKTLPGTAALVPVLKPTVKGDQVLVALDEKNRGADTLREVLLKPALTQARQAASESQSMNAMKQIGLAMHNYMDVNRTFPAAYTVDKQGKPLLSWRVAILPYIEQNQLYQQFHLDEPWDSEHNKKLIAKMPKLYASPASKVAKEGKTAYVTLRGESTIFPGEKGVPIADIRDGTSNTIMTVEVDDQHAVIWTKPDDFQFNPEKPHDGLAGQYENIVIIGFADGSVRAIKLNVDAQTLKGLGTRSGGETPGQF